MRPFIISLLATMSFVFIGCSNIKMLTPEDIYSKDFLQRMNQIQSTFKGGDKDSALAQLDALDNSLLSEAELGKKRNFKGIIYFSKGEFEKASELFESAKGLIRLDRPLAAQSRLNLASSYYKL
ncbi:MAG: hypothetical protein KC478_10140, partial [Bacteriovoracaceae bacterium]|nr:hypothetical protein [Bacteriovoracaceae bacterium]